MTEVDQQAAARERFAQTPRPLRFVRLRVYRGGPAEYLKTLLEDEKAAELENLSEYRTKGLPEESPAIEECRNNLRYLIGFLRDLDSAMIDMVGPDPAE
jgi:hypothetical protein